MTAPIQVTIDGAGGGAGMSVLEFVAAMTQALVWPVAAIIIATILRKPLIKLLSKLRSLGWGEVKAEFGEQLDDAEVKVETLSVVAPLDEVSATQADPYEGATFQEPAYATFETVAVASPAAAILNIWSHIYKLLNELAAVHGVKARNAKTTIQQLHLKNVLTGLTVSLLEDLRNMRNLAAHAGASDREVGLTDAIRYRGIAQAVEPGLRRAIKNPSSPAA